VPVAQFGRIFEGRVPLPLGIEQELQLRPVVTPNYESTIRCYLAGEPVRARSVSGLGASLEVGEMAAGPGNGVWVSGVGAGRRRRNDLCLCRKPRTPRGVRKQPNRTARREGPTRRGTDAAASRAGKKASGWLPPRDGIGSRPPQFRRFTHAANASRREALHGVGKGRRAPRPLRKEATLQKVDRTTDTILRPDASP